MSTQTAQLELTQSSVPKIVVARSVGDETLRPDRPLGVARGITVALLIAAPFWALFAFALYLLI
jgi:hypothetical protein